MPWVNKEEKGSEMRGIIYISKVSFKSGDEDSFFTQWTDEVKWQSHNEKIKKMNLNEWYKISLLKSIVEYISSLKPFMNNLFEEFRKNIFL